MYTFLYLFAIIAANMIVTWLGAWVTPITSFVFIGLDITTRDKLHDSWKGRGLLWKMSLLIFCGSALSFIINRNAARVAFASFAAFLVSSAIDAVVYHFIARSRFERVNWSNLASAAADSILFPAIAFGWPPPLEIVYGQATAKIAGGLFWSLVFHNEHIDTQNEV